MKPDLERSSKPLIRRPQIDVPPDFHHRLFTAVVMGLDFGRRGANGYVDRELFRQLRRYRDQFEAASDGNAAVFRATNGAFLLALARRPFILDSLRFSALSALCQRNLTQAFLWLKPKDAELVKNVVGDMLSREMRWLKIWNGVAAVTTVAATLLDQKYRVLYTNPYVDAQEKIDLLCGPVGDLHATFAIQVRSRRRTTVAWMYDDIIDGGEPEDDETLIQIQQALNTYPDDDTPDPYIPVVICGRFANAYSSAYLNVDPQLKATLKEFLSVMDPQKESRSIMRTRLAP